MILGETGSPLLWSAAILCGGGGLHFLLGRLGARLDRARHALGGPIRAIRNLLIPTVALYLLLRNTAQLDEETIRNFS